MRFNPESLKIRKPLWVALSDLFLDTELHDCHQNNIARVMKESGYSLSEIEDILMLEVFPVCIANMYSMTGIWTGFDEGDLCEAIISSEPPGKIKQWLNKRSFRMVEESWEMTVEIYNSDFS